MQQTGKLTAELQATIVQLIRVGNTVEHAAATAGIHRDTFYVWMRRGEKTGKDDAPYREFAEAVEQARRECEASLVTRISKAAANGSWGAAAWLLERRFGERWSKPDKQEKPPGDETADSSPFADLDAADELAPRRARRTE